MTPLKFRPIFKHTIWGGGEIARFKHLNGHCDDIGESWEVSGFPGEETPVVGGPYDGATLRQLTEQLGAALVGRENLRRHGTRFPLLVKFIAAESDLSIQVHPDEAMARRLGLPNGKNEMWYVVDARPGAAIITGFCHDFSADLYERSLGDGSLCDHLCRYETHAGDCFYIPAGQIHSIGAGNLLIEVQQTSNDTYRVYDFDRLDKDGLPRELHTELAREALCYDSRPDYRTHYDEVNDGCSLLGRCPNFTMRLGRFASTRRLDYAALDSFVIFIAFEGRARLTDGEGNTVSLCAGETVLFPATNDAVTVEPLDGARFSFIETFTEG